MEFASVATLEPRRAGPAVASRIQAAARWRYALAAVTLLALAVRLPGFRTSLFGDEVGAWWIVRGSFGHIFYLLSGHSPEANPPLWFMLSWLSEQIFGASAQSLKLVSLLAGTATVPLVFVFGRRTLGARVALLAALLLALDPFAAYYSAEARPYALLMFLCLLTAYLLLRAIDLGGAGRWVVFALSACACAYTHYTSVYPVGLMVIWAVVARPRVRRQVLLAAAAAAVGFLPWLPQVTSSAASTASHALATLQPFTASAVRVAVGKALIGHPYLPLSRVPGSLAAVLSVAGLILAAAGLLWRLNSTRADATPPVMSAELGLVALLALAAPLGVGLYSLHTAIWDARNLISCLPAVALLGAAMVIAGRGRLALTGGALLVLGLAIGTWQTTRLVNQRMDYQSAAAYIDQHSPSSTPVVDLVAPTPGPPTETETALRLDAPDEHHPVLRLGLPPLNEVLKVPPYTPLAQVPGSVVAREAIRLARRDVFFLVIPGRATAATLTSVARRHLGDSAGELGALDGFLGALPASFRPNAIQVFPGFSDVSVFTYSRRRG